MAVRAGASLLGLVSEMPSGPGVVDEATIKAIAAATPPGVESVLLTSQTAVGAIVAQHRRLSTTAIQLVDALRPGAHEELRRRLPGIRLIQVLHVTGPDTADRLIAEARALTPFVDALLLDSGNPGAPTKVLGGTGKVHDWSTSRAIVEALPQLPIFLAGGLRPDNVAQAITEVGPYGLDVCTGLRTEGALDTRKLDAFVAAARGILS